MKHIQFRSPRVWFKQQILILVDNVICYLDLVGRKHNINHQPSTSPWHCSAYASFPPNGKTLCIYPLPSTKVLLNFVDMIFPPIQKPFRAPRTPEFYKLSTIPSSPSPTIPYVAQRESIFELPHFQNLAHSILLNQFSITSICMTRHNLKCHRTGKRITIDGLNQ